MKTIITCDDVFGYNELLKSIAPQTHMIDIRVRMNGKYYWFEGDFLKQVLPSVKFNRIEKDSTPVLSNREETT